MGVQNSVDKNGCLWNVGVILYSLGAPAASDKGEGKDIIYLASSYLHRRKQAFKTCLETA